MAKKKKRQKNKRRSSKHKHKAKDRVTRTPLKTGGELRHFGRVSSSCSTSGSRHVNLVTNPEIIMNEERIRKCLRQVERIRGHSGQPSHSGDRKAIHKALQKPDKSLMHNIRVSTKHTYKTKDRVTRTTLKPGVNSDAPEEWAVPASLMAPVVLIWLQIR